MTVTVRLFATLAKYAPAGGEAVPAAPGETVARLLSRLAIPAEAVTTVLVNGQAAGLATPLADGDQVSLLPALSGG